MDSSFAVLSRVHFRATVRDRSALVFTFLFPAAILAVFGALFGANAVSGTGKTVIDYMGPGVLCYGVANAAMLGSGVVVVRWRRDQLLRLVRMTPAPTWVTVGSRLAVTLALALAQTLLFGAVATMPGLDLRISVLDALAALPAVIAGVLVFSAMGILIANLVGSPEAVIALGNFLLMPMAFMSGSFIPISTAPAWLQDVSYAIPLRYMNSGVSDAVAGSVAGALGNSLILLGIAVVLGLLAARTFRWGWQR